VGHHRLPVGEQAGTVLAQALVTPDVLVGERLCRLERALAGLLNRIALVEHVEDGVDLAGEIDRGRPGVSNAGGFGSDPLDKGRVVVGVDSAGRERHAVGPRCPKRRRAAHAEHLDTLDQVVDSLRTVGRVLGRELRLVDHDHAVPVLVPVDRSHTGHSTTEGDNRFSVTGGSQALLHAAAVVPGDRVPAGVGQPPPVEGVGERDDRLRGQGLDIVEFGGEPVVVRVAELLCVLQRSFELSAVDVFCHDGRSGQLSRR